MARFLECLSREEAAQKGFELLDDRSYTPRAGRGTEARNQLLQSAKQLMGARGYAAIGVEEVCKKVGVRKGSFYYYFPSKQKLAMEAIDSYLEDHEERFARTLDGDGSPLERIQRLVQLYYELHSLSHANGGYIEGCPLANLELSTRDEPIRRRLERAFEVWVKRLEPVLAQAMACGEIETSDPMIAAEELLAYFEGVVLLAKARNDPGVIKRLDPGALRLPNASCAEPVPGRAEEAARVRRGAEKASRRSN